VLKLAAPEPKEQQLSAKAVDCCDSIEGQAFRQQEQITNRNRGLRHAQELFGKFGSACCLLILMIVSREWIAAWLGFQMMIIVRCSSLQGMLKQAQTNRQPKSSG
jgi:hypothetical protein